MTFGGFTAWCSRSHLGKGRRQPPTAIGAPVMALGIFGAAALQRLPAGPALTKPLAVALTLACVAIAWGLLVSMRRDGLSVHKAPLLGSFGIGTWVAATAVTARMLMLAAPALSWPARSFFAASFALWLWFTPIAVGNLARLAAGPVTRPTGAILLTTVAAQAIALLGLRLFPDVAPVRWTAMALMGFGVASYVAGLFLIARRYASFREWRIVTDWDSTNCILHGALSITGLAAVVSGSFPAASLVAFWIGVVAVFAIVETIEVARLVARVRELGWLRGLWMYDVTQWARNFTFGMFYAFTLAFAETVPVLSAHPVLERLRNAVLADGKYVVLALLLAEGLLLLWPKTDRQR